MRFILKASSLIVFGFVVALGLLEITFRLAGVGGPAELDPTYDRPRSAYVPHGDRQHPWSEAGGSVLRVAVIGDSFTNAFANQWGDGYPKRLELLLNLNSGVAPVELRAFAMNGTSTWQQLRFLEEALNWGAELIVLGLFINDTEDKADPDLAARQQRMLPRVPTGFTRRVLQASRSLAWIYLRYENIRRSRAALAHQEYVYDPEYSGWKKFQRAIRRFARTCRTRRVRLVAVIWPSMGGLGPGYPHRIAHQRMAEALAQTKIPYLDLLPEFEGKSSVRLSAYPEIDTHPNEIGHRIGATAIFEFLVSQGHVDAAYRAARSRVAGEGHFLNEVRRKRSPEYYP